LTPLPGGELLLFGGEVCDGEGTTVFNDVFRWNLDKQTWRLVEVGPRDIYPKNMTFSNIFFLKCRA